jgi:hypothetical protein
MIVEHLWMVIMNAIVEAHIPNIVKFSLAQDNVGIVIRIGVA